MTRRLASVMHRLGMIAFALLAAALPRGLRPPMPAPDPTMRGVRVPVTPGQKGRGGSNGQHKLLISALRAMPLYDTKAERNAAKRVRRARRLAGVHS